MLREMDFKNHQVEIAWNNSQNKSVEGLIEYLDANNVDPDPEKCQHLLKKKPDFVQNIAHLIKSEIVNELKIQGFSQIVSEKATLLSGNKDLQSALSWIMQNQSSPDFEDPIQVETKPTISPEEAKIRALEMQKKIREEIEKKEKEAQLESEKLRMKMGKEMLDTKRLMDEQRTKLEMDEYLREKEKTESEKQQMLKKLEEDKIARFGKLTVKEQKPKTIKERFDELYQKLYKAHRLGGISTLAECLKLIKMYIDNIVKNPNEEKYRKINGSNPKFCEKVKDIPGGVPLLALIGFKEEGGFFVLTAPNIQEVQEFSGLINDEFNKIT